MIEQTNGRHSRFAAITFDVGETLVRPYPSFGAAFGRVCRQAGLRLSGAQAITIEAALAKRLAEFQSAGRPIFDSIESSRGFWLGLYRGFFEELGFRLPDELATELSETLYRAFSTSTSYRLFADARPALRAARRRGFRVGILSNWEAWLTTLLADHRLDGLVDFSVISGICGYEKPDARIFQLAADAAGVPPERILHVGDSLRSDAHGARAAGLACVLLDRAGVHPDADCPRVATLRDLWALLEPGGALGPEVG